MASPVEISVVIPCLNEERAIAEVVAWGWEGIERTGRGGEVIVVDNGSTDRSVELAREAGARVVREPRPGYGSAYLRGLAEARGEYVFMADGDGTYDLRDMEPFLEQLDSGKGIRARLPLPRSHPRRRDALEAPLDRQPDPDGDPERLLRGQGLRTPTAACVRSGGAPSPASTCTRPAWSSPPR